jgi:hypothetical protein
MSVSLLSVNCKETEPEANDPDEGYSIPTIPESGRSAEEWDKLANQGSVA